MNVYISGPITENKDYQEEFNKAKAAIEAKGHVVVSPADLHILRESCFSWSDAMKICITLLERCDCLVLLPDWGISVGARIEHSWARQISMVVYDGVDELPVA